MDTDILGSSVFILSIHIHLRSNTPRNGAHEPRSWGRRTSIHRSFPGRMAAIPRCSAPRAVRHSGGVAYLHINRTRHEHATQEEGSGAWPEASHQPATAERPAGHTTPAT